MVEDEIWEQWRQNRTPENNQRLLKVLEPRIEYAVQKFNTAGIPESVLRTNAKKIALNQAQSFDPNMGVQLSTHISHGLRKMTDFVEDEKNTVRIPNYLRNQIPIFLQAREKLTDRLKRDPNTEEISEYLKIGKNLTSKLETAVQRKELTSSLSNFDVGTPNVRHSEEEDIYMYYYDIKDPKEKLVFEHTFGIFSKQKMKPKDIADRANLHEQKVRRMQIKFAEKIKGYSV